MKIRVDNQPGRRKCRYCKLKARWDFMRNYGLWNQTNTPVCDLHLGTALRNIGLTKLSIEQTSVAEAEIRP